jgi:hypothetical protein
MQLNGHNIEPGCYVDGHWGQYGTDRLAEIAEGHGWTPESPYKNPRFLRAEAEKCDEDNVQHDLWEMFHEADDAIIDWLNDHTIDGVWGWDDGELFLRTAKDWQELYGG